MLSVEQDDDFQSTSIGYFVHLPATDVRLNSRVFDTALGTLV